MLAKGFLVASAIIGLPAVLGTCFFGFSTVRMAMAEQKPQPSAPSGEGGPLIAGLSFLDYAAGKAGRVFDAVAFGLSKALLAASAGALLFAAGLYFTSRGLYAGLLWSRIAGGALLTALFLFSLLMVLSRLGGSASMLALATLGLSGYGLWVILLRFA